MMSNSRSRTTLTLLESRSPSCYRMPQSQRLIQMQCHYRRIDGDGTYSGLIEGFRRWELYTREIFGGVLTSIMLSSGSVLTAIAFIDYHDIFALVYFGLEVLRVLVWLQIPNERRPTYRFETLFFSRKDCLRRKEREESEHMQLICLSKWWWVILCVMSSATLYQR